MRKLKIIFSLSVLWFVQRIGMFKLNIYANLSPNVGYLRGFSKKDKYE